MLVVEHRPDDLVARVAVRVADGDRLVDLVAAAVLLAGRRADAAQHGRERDRPLEDPGRLAEVGLGVGLEEARDVDVARALVLAGRQAVGVVVAEDQLEVRRPQPADTPRSGSVTFMPASAAREQQIGGCSSPSTSTTHIRHAPKPGQLGLVAQRRDLDPVVAADLEDRLALEPLDQRPSTSIRIGGVDCGRCGAWVVISRSAGVSARGSIVSRHGVGLSGSAGRGGR